MALTTTATVKTYAGISGSGADAQIDVIVSAVDRSMKEYLGRQIESASVTAEIHDGNGLDDSLILLEWPVTSVSSVSIDGAALAASDHEIDGANGILHYKPGGTGFAPWPKGRRNISVTYTAGYASVPADLALAATKQAVYEVKLTSALGGRLGDRSTITEDGGTAQYVIAGWYPGVAEVLDAYRGPRCR